MGSQVMVGNADIDNQATEITIQAPFIFASALEISSRALTWPARAEILMVLQNYATAVAAVQ